MEYTNWKMLISEWIQCTKFIDVTSDCVEHTNIDQFYEEFKNKLTSITLKQSTITEFLKAHYGSFEFHLDDLKEISSLDYVYIYSLLLHFSCVKYPDQHFHKLCQSLDDTSQTCIAKFFNLLMVNNNFDRDTIRSAITAAKPVSAQLMSVDSPIKTPHKNLSPTTPRTTYMEDKRRELILLKAQLDSERYERSVLEMLLKQTEQKVEKMGHNQKRYIEEIQSLKNELLSQDVENRSPNRNYFSDQKNYRLQKDILEKEEKIIELQLTIENLMDDKKMASEKLVLNEKQMSNWIDKTRDLEQVIIDLKNELEDRFEKIKCLQETNAELQNFIRESRGGIHGLDSLNTSSCDGLDFSFARIANSSNISTSSPENLGRSVIDVQLKEKQIENDMLREKLELLKHDFNVISTEIRNLCNSTEGIQSEDLKQNVDEYSLPLKQFEMCKNYFVEKLAISENFIKNLSNENNAHKVKLNELEEAHDKLKSTITKMEQEYSIKERVFNAKTVELEEVILNKISENTELYTRIEKAESDITKFKAINIELEQSVELLSNQIETMTNATSRLENDIAVANETVNEIKTLCESRYVEIETLGCQNDLLKAENKDVIATITQLQATLDNVNTTNAEENRRLTTEIVELSHIVATITDEKVGLAEKIAKLIQTSNAERESSNAEIETLKCTHQHLANQILTLTAENSEVRSENALSEEKIQLLTQKVFQLSNEKVSAADANRDLLEKIAELGEKEDRLIESHQHMMETMTDTSSENLILTQQITETNLLNVEFQAEIEQLNSVVCEMREARDDMENRLVSKTKELSDEIAELGNTNTELTLEINTLKVSNQEYVEKIVLFEDEKTKLKSNILDAETQIDALNEIVRQSEQEISDLTVNKTKLLETNATLSADIAQLSTDKEQLITKSREEIARLQEEVHKLGTQIEQLNPTNHKFTKQITCYELRIAELNTQIENAAQEKEKLNNKIGSLESEVQSLTTTSDKLIGTNSEFKSRISTLEELNTDLCGQVEKAQQTNSELAHEISSSRTRIEELTEEIKRNDLERTNLKCEVDELIVKNSELGLDIVALSKEKNEMVENLTTELTSNTAKNAELKTQVESCTNEIATLKKTKSELTSNIEALTETNSRLTAEFSNGESKMVELAEELSKSVGHGVELKREIEELSNKFSELAGENSKLHAAVTDLSRQRDEMVVQIAAIKSEKESLSQANELLSKEKCELEVSISDREEEIQQATELTTKTISDLQTQINEHTTNCVNLTDENSRIQNKLALALEQNARLSGNIENLTETNSRLTAEVANGESKVIELTETLSSSVSESEELKWNIEQLSNKYSELASENGKLHTAISELSKEREVMTVQIEEIKSEKESLSQTNDSLSKEKSELEARIIKKEEDIQQAADETTKTIADLRLQVDKSTTKCLELSDEKSRIQTELANLAEASSNTKTELVHEIGNLKNLNEAITKEKVEITEKVSQLEKDCATSELRITELTEEIAKISTDKSEIESALNAKLSKLDEEKSKLIREITEAKSVSIDLNSKIVDLERDIESLRRTNEVASTSNLELTETIAKLQDEAVILNTKLVELSISVAKMQELNQKVDEMSVKNSELTNTNLLLQSEVSQLSELSEENSRHISKLLDEICELRKMNEAIETEKSALIGKISELEERCSNAECRAREFGNEISKILHEKEEITTKLEVEISELITQKDELVQQVHSSKVEIQTLSQTGESAAKSNVEFVEKIARLEEVESNLSAKLAGTVNQIEQLRKTVDETTSKSTELSSEKSRLESKISQLLSVGEERAQHVLELNTEIAALKNDNQLIVREKTDLIEKLQASNTAAESRIEELLAEISKISIDKNDVTVKYEAEVAELSEQKDKLVHEIGNLKLEIQTLRETSESALQINVQSEEIISKLKDECCTINAQIEKANIEISSYVTRTQDLDRTVGEASGKITELRSEIEQLVTEKIAINKRVEQLEGDFDRLSAEKLQVIQEKDKYVDEVSKITAENTILNCEVNALQMEVKQLLQSTESHATENAERIAKHENHVRELTETINELSLKTTDMETELVELRTKAEKSRESHLRLTEEIFNSESILKELSTEKAELDERLLNLTAENKSQADKIAAMDAEIRIEKDRWLKKAEQLNREIDNLVQNYESIQKDKAELNVNYKMAQTELNALKESQSDVHTQKLQLIEKEQTIVSLESNLTKLQKEKVERDTLLTREKELNEKFTEDIAILKAKLYKHREISEEREKQWHVEKAQLMDAIEDQKTAEDRITENRLELVGKLEKMKMKMKALYNEEMVKVKNKHEHEMQEYQKQAKENYAKYDAHIEKLSTQIYQLNERNLGLEKDNKFLRTKIDFLEVSTGTGSTMALNSLGSGGSRNLLQSTNLKMEDEEGEIFNNTYLTDLKTGGRISPTAGGLGRDSVRFTELQHRNSLMPRHLRSTYAAQYGDQDLREEDLKDPLLNFDDSLSSLLYGGQRKKVTGATTYKRPGPPTPSKNAGRLSFGAVTELQTRDILRENNENIPTRLSMTSGGFGTGHKKNTPGKLKSLFSNSTSKIKDDFYPDSFNKSISRKAHQIENLIITSTPRRRSQITRHRGRLSGRFHKMPLVQRQLMPSLKASMTSTTPSSACLSLAQLPPLPYQDDHGKWRQSGSPIIDSESGSSTSQTCSDHDEQSVHDRNSTIKSITSNVASSTPTRRQRLSSKFAVNTSTTHKLNHARNRYRMKSKEKRLENYNRSRQSIFALRKSLLGRNSGGSSLDCESSANDAEKEAFALLKNVFELSSQAVAITNFNTACDIDDDDETILSSFAEFEKLAKCKVSHVSFDNITPIAALDTSMRAATKSCSLKRIRRHPSLYSGGVIVNRKIPRLSIRIGGYHILNRDDGGENSSIHESTKSFEQTTMLNNASGGGGHVVAVRSMCQLKLFWRHCNRRWKAAILILSVILIFNCIIAFMKIFY